MTDKELSRLRRTELLEMLIAQGKEYARMQEQLKAAEKALHKRELTIEKAGTMADAAYQLNDVVGSTQRAVDLYIENVKRTMEKKQEEADEAVSKARAFATETVDKAEKRARLLLNDANEQAEQILSGARDEAARIIARAGEEAEQIRSGAQKEKDELLQHNPDSQPPGPSVSRKPRGFFKARQRGM